MCVCLCGLVRSVLLNGAIPAQVAMSNISCSLSSLPRCVCVYVVRVNSYNVLRPSAPFGGFKMSGVGREL